MMENNRSQELLGKTLGTCTIERIIGQGGMGVVYLARQQRPSRYVAVKVLLPATAMNNQMHQHYLARFRREADIIATLDYIHIIPIYEYGEQNGLAYLVMPYLQGGSLHDTLTARGSLSLQETIQYVNQIAGALEYAHAHSVIHRDLKPANFLFHSDRRLLLSDFGIAHIMQTEVATIGAPLTEAGTFPGTPHYMAPEMFLGEQIDHRIDIYALGVIVYQLLSGQLPFNGETPYAIITRHINDAPPSLHQLNASIPPEVDTVVQKALAKKRDERFSSVREFAQALSTAAGFSVQGGKAVSSDAPTLMVASPQPDISNITIPAHQADTKNHAQRKGRPSEERKLVTILFASIDIDSALDETLDPEDVRAVTERYHKLMQQVVSKYGGKLETVTGDTVMAIFGLPQVHGNEAERACAAALALRDALKSEQSGEEHLLLQTAINTGEVVVINDIQKGKDDVKGDVVNTVTRLQQAAHADEILVDERTMQAARATCAFGTERSVKLKGKKQPLRVAPLVEVHQTRQIDRPKLVGRRQDLLQLELLKGRVLEEQRPQLVSIIAPTGTGKTRLVEEILSRLDPADGFQHATARCLPYGQSLPFWPLRSLLAELIGDEIDRQHLMDAFIRGGQTRENASRQAEHILTTLSMEQEDNSDLEDFFPAWRLLIELLARQTPRIIIFEDLQWAHDRLLDLVEHLMHPRTQAPLLIMALSRPELLERRPNWGGGQRNFMMLNLEPLSEGQTRQLIGQLTTEVSLEMQQRIVERASGNPYFAIELVRFIVEQGITGKDAEPDVLPDTVHAAVLARLDRLSPLERSVVQVAAVVGHSFRSTLLHTVLNEFQPVEIDAALDALGMQNLIVPAEEESYVISHILIRDVAYGTLSRAERIRLHAAIVKALEPLAAEHGDEYMELFAYHYREAAHLAQQSAVPLDLPFDMSRALYPRKRRERGKWLELDFS